MTSLLSLLLLYSLLVGTPTGIISTRSQDNDVAAKTDISALASGLEMHYSRNGEYPTEKELTQEPDTSLPGVDSEAFYDGDGAFINSGKYRYQPTECTALGCKHFTLVAILSDQTTFQKQSVR